MKNIISTIVNSDLVALLWKSRYIKIVGFGLAVLTLTLGFQAFQIYTDSVGQDDVAREEAVTVTVNVGEMFFEHADESVPTGFIEARTGDSIEFVNVGNLRHSVTIDELGFNEVINPGQSTTLVVSETVDDIRVNCRFHTGHEASLTVTEGTTDSTRHDASDTHSGDMASSLEPYEGDLPVRSAEDAIDQLEFEIVDGVKEFRLTAEHIVWEYAEGFQLESWAFNGQLPGPEIRVVEGDQVRVIFENNLPDATTVHWHGVDVPNEADGVPGVTQDPVQPGETFVYEFTADPAGTRYYHAHGSHHGDEQQQVDMGLSGPFVIEPANYQAPDREYTMVLTERPEAGIYPINGRVYPNPEIFEVSEGETVRIRMIHAGSAEIHPMHMHGHQFSVVAIDGNPVPAGTEQLRNTQPMMPGEIYDIEFTADNPGAWVFHCHHLGHAAGGMIAEIRYE